MATLLYMYVNHELPLRTLHSNAYCIPQGSRYKLTNDGMFHLDIPKTRQYDTGKVEVIARNSVGESIASTELNVVARSDDYRNVLKNSPRRKYNSLSSHFYTCQIYRYIYELY